MPINNQYLNYLFMSWIIIGGGGVLFIFSFPGNMRQLVYIYFLWQNIYIPLFKVAKTNFEYRIKYKIYELNLLQFGQFMESKDWSFNNFHIGVGP